MYDAIVNSNLAGACVILKSALSNSSSNRNLNLIQAFFLIFVYLFVCLFVFVVVFCGSEHCMVSFFNCL